MANNLWDNFFCYRSW